MKPKIYKIAIPDKEVLQMYYSSTHRMIDKNDIMKLFNCKDRKARELIYQVKKNELEKNNKRYDVGIIPFDKAFEYLEIDINLIEKNYMKQVKLGL